jgi:ribitol-5-phosphate 2-dehydrogenase (NADP+) / D-ribitol-5-phosphate cytidylyltransferase
MIFRKCAIVEQYMFNGMRMGAILLMGGEGRRFGSDTPKQFHILGDKMVFRHALDTMQTMGIFDEIVLVCHPDWLNLSVEGARVVCGGPTRQQSSYRGLKSFLKRPDVVLIHDAVRPFVSERIIRENIAGAMLWGAVDTCIPSADTLVHAPGGQVIAEIPKREEYLRGQTPQTFRMDWIAEAHEKAAIDGIESASDDCRLVLRLGKNVYIVKGDEQNIKITSELDILIAEQHLLKK